jgi:acetyltransferase-like isoleucine patch superfamily enzyme
MLKTQKKLNLPSIWRRLKTVPYLGKYLAYTYYFFSGVSKDIKGKKNKIDIDTLSCFPFLNNVSFKIRGNSNIIYIKGEVRLSNLRIEIYGSHNQVFIDEKCKIKGGEIWVEDYDCKVKIGRETTIESDFRLHVSEPKSSIIIGEDCMFACSVYIRCADSHSIIDLDTKKRTNYAKDIKIGNHVWIGNRAQILKGLNIDNDSIVAAGAIVTKDIPSNCIAAGIPATVKRERITWDRSKIYEKDS